MQNGIASVRADCWTRTEDFSDLATQRAQAERLLQRITSQIKDLVVLHDVFRVSGDE
jgi:hypothetical protein